jgi:hypothetical protein
MPYLTKRDRNVIDSSPIGDSELQNPRELAYAVMQLVLQYVSKDKKLYPEAMGAVDLAKEELYRKYINPLSAQHEFENE